MGYRSDVTVVMEFNSEDMFNLWRARMVLEHGTNDEFIAYMAGFREVSYTETIALIMEIGSIKWYGGYGLTDITMAGLNLIEEIDGGGGGIVVIGEDIDDISLQEYRGDHSDFSIWEYLDVRRYTELDVRLRETKDNRYLT
jgi:hypothetical protein